ncbi:hypothetical protein B0H13DRAFT_2342438 [Mycena leptocephala]|nr:hypothetical protein B0H13DRAFT_2342438 [Mycena leptocephala]
MLSTSASHRPRVLYSPTQHISSAYSNWRSLAYRLGEHALTEIPLARIPRRCQLHHTPRPRTPARRRDFVVECALNCEPTPTRISALSLTPCACHFFCPTLIISAFTVLHPTSVSLSYAVPPIQDVCDYQESTYVQWRFLIPQEFTLPSYAYTP